MRHPVSGGLPFEVWLILAAVACAVIAITAKFSSLGISIF
jgi:hypothetical protein